MNGRVAPFADTETTSARLPPVARLPLDCLTTSLWETSLLHHLLYHWSIGGFLIKWCHHLPSTGSYFRQLVTLPRWSHTSGDYQQQTVPELSACTTTHWGPLSAGAGGGAFGRGGASAGPTEGGLSLQIFQGGEGILPKQDSESVFTTGGGARAGTDGPRDGWSGLCDNSIDQKLRDSFLIYKTPELDCLWRRSCSLEFFNSNFTH